MADVKISALTALTGAGTATDDVIAIVDTSASATKKQTIAELAVAMTANITALDAAKIGGGAVSNTEFSYLDGVTSAIQTQLTAKIASTTTLATLATYDSNGLFAQTATNTFVGRTVTGTTNKITVTNGDGVSGNPTLTVGSDIVQLTSTQTLTNKTLTTPIIATISNTGTLTLPTSTDTLVGKATTDTLTNKTLTAPVIATIVNSGTLTLPTSTDTLVGKATTDTLTNKTLTTPTINGSKCATTTKTANYTATTADRYINVDATSGAMTVALPAIATSVGLVIEVMKIDAGVNTVTIDADSTETINGATTKVLSTQYSKARVVCFADGWYIYNT